MIDHRLFFKQHGAGEPLLLIHGLLMDGRMFEPLIPLLAPARRLIIPDLRGHGQSRGLPPPYTVAQHAADLLAVLDALGVETTAVLGYSQGGAVAQELARHHADRVTHLFLVCTYAHNMLSGREKIEGRLLSWLMRLLPLDIIAALMTTQTKALPPEQAGMLREMVAGQDKKQALAALWAMQQFDSRAWLAELRCPTHIVAGRADTAVPIHHAELLHRDIPRSTLRVIDDAGHLLAWTHPAELAAEIDKRARSG